MIFILGVGWGNAMLVLMLKTNFFFGGVDALLMKKAW
jgi:hypothetical protein